MLSVAEGATTGEKGQLATINSTNVNGTKSGGSITLGNYSLGYQGKALTFKVSLPAGLSLNSGVGFSDNGKLQMSVGGGYTRENGHVSSKSVTYRAGGIGTAVLLARILPIVIFAL